MPPIHLSEFEKNSLTYYEHNRRFSLSPEMGTRMKAYNIDVCGAGNQYFKSVYAQPQIQGRRSADGIYVGSCHKNGRQLHFVIVVELEGHSSFDEASDQVKATMDHFCRDSIDDSLGDDGSRHHLQAMQTPRPYLFQEKHIVIGLVIGSTGRQGELKQHKGFPIVCLNSRQPVQDKTPLALLEEIAAYTGQPFW
jgi:hypothetical protein